MDAIETKVNIGKNIDYILTEEDISYTDFAKELGVTLAHLMNVIKGLRGLSITKLLEVSKITGYSIEFIITGKKVPIEDVIKEKLETAKKLIKEAERVIESISCA